MFTWPRSPDPDVRTCLTKLAEISATLDAVLLLLSQLTMTAPGDVQALLAQMQPSTKPPRIRTAADVFVPERPRAKSAATAVQPSPSPTESPTNP